MKTKIYANLIARIYDKSNKSQKVKNFLLDLYTKLNNFFENEINEHLESKIY